MAELQRLTCGCWPGAAQLQRLPRSCWTGGL